MYMSMCMCVFRDRKIPGRTNPRLLIVSILEDGGLCLGVMFPFNVMCLYCLNVLLCVLLI